MRLLKVPNNILICETCECSRCSACRRTQEGREYTGTQSTTVSGRTCQEWAASVPHRLSAEASNDANYPDGSRAAAINYCRNPDPSWSGGLWCYTTDQNVKWEECDVPLCIGRCACRRVVFLMRYLSQQNFLSMQAD